MLQQRQVKLSRVRKSVKVVRHVLIGTDGVFRRTWRDRQPDIRLAIRRINGDVRMVDDTPR